MKKRIRILLVGDASGPLDEGMKIITWNLARVLASEHDVRVLLPKSVISIRQLFEVRSFQPDIVHYVHGPTIRSFLVTKFLSLLIPHAVTVMSAPRPELSLISRRIIPILKPDILLVQSRNSHMEFSRLGCKVSFLYAGVSLEIFRPLSREGRSTLRKRYGISGDGFVLLHVGPVTERRGANFFARVKSKIGDAITVYLVGSVTNPPDMQVVEQLRDSGCTVHLGYIEHIEECYQLADCYVFPGLERSSAIEIPISILEAMACNLPVVAGWFGGLPDIFEERDGFCFAHDEDEFLAKIDKIMQNSAGIVRTRVMVEELSWDRVSRRLTKLYQYLIDRGNPK